MLRAKAPCPGAAAAVLAHAAAVEEFSPGAETRALAGAYPAALARAQAACTARRQGRRLDTCLATTATALLLRGEPRLAVWMSRHSSTLRAALASLRAPHAERVVLRGLPIRSAVINGDSGDQLREGYESEVLDFIDSLPPDAVFYDLGASIGHFSLCAAARGLRTFGFEPDPTNYAVFDANARANRFPNLTTVSIAISDRRDEAAVLRGNSAKQRVCPARVPGFAMLRRLTRVDHDSDTWPSLAATSVPVRSRVGRNQSPLFRGTLIDSLAAHGIPSKLGCPRYRSLASQAGGIAETITLARRKVLRRRTICALG
jgi:hypothetical protein